MEVQSLPLSQINGVSGLNVRKGDPVKELEDLKSSIDNIGIQQPLLIREKGDERWVIAGRRRYNAAKELDKESVPARVREMTDDEAFKLSATENIQSKRMTTPQKKRLVENSLDRYGSLGRAADMIGKSKETLRSWEPFTTLPNVVLEMVKERSSFFEKDARAIGKLTGSTNGSFEELAVERAELMSDLSKKDKEHVKDIMTENPDAGKEELTELVSETTTPVEIKHEISGNGAEALREKAKSKPYDVSPEQLAVQEINEFVDEL